MTPPPPDEPMPFPGLRAVATPQLRRLRDALRRNALQTPLSRSKLMAQQLGSLWEHFAALQGLDRAALLAVLDCILAERSDQALQRSPVQLVWTGPEGRTGWSRPTAAVVRDLLETAQRSVLLAGYSFDHGDSILEPLHQALKVRGVQASLYLHIERAPKKTGSTDAELVSYATREIAGFLARNWPFGPPYPDLYYDPRTLRPGSTESMHAKCLVVDDRRSLIGSANFTDRGHSRNIEVGVVIDDEPFAQAVCSQLRSATASGAFVKWHPGA